MTTLIAVTGKSQIHAVSAASATSFLREGGQQRPRTIEPGLGDELSEAGIESACRGICACAIGEARELGFFR
jgi:hypothetical protein